MPTLEVEVDGRFLRERWDELRRFFREASEDVMTEEDLAREEERERLLIRAEVEVEAVSVEGGELTLYISSLGGEAGRLFVEASIPVNDVLEAVTGEAVIRRVEGSRLELPEGWDGSLVLCLRLR